MTKKLTYQAAFIAAVLALVGIIVQLVGNGAMADGLVAQPYGVAAEIFLQGVNESSSATLLFFAGDTLLPLSYLMIFVVLYAATRDRSHVFALVGLGLGIATALLDITENSFFITYALLAHNGAPLSDVAIVPVYILTTLKWTAAFGTLYAFGLVFPRKMRLEKLMVVLMLSFPVFGALSTALPALILGRSLFLLAGMVIFAVYFWQRWQMAGVGDDT